MATDVDVFKGLLEGLCQISARLCVVPGELEDASALGPDVGGAETRHDMLGQDSMELGPRHEPFFAISRRLR